MGESSSITQETISAESQMKHARIVTLVACAVVGVYILLFLFPTPAFLTGSDTDDYAGARSVAFWLLGLGILVIPLAGVLLVRGCWFSVKALVRDGHLRTPSNLFVALVSAIGTLCSGWFVLAFVLEILT